MTYRSREEQGNWNSSGKMALMSHLIHKGDEAFDTPDLPRMMQPLNWLHETDVHGATKITGDLRNSNQFVGTQAMIVRDEVRKQTFVIAIEHSGLYLYTVVDALVVSRQAVHEGDVRRAHVALRKYDGMPVVAYTVRDGDGWRLGINGSVVPDVTADVDFPFVTFNQPPIGYPAPTPPELCLLTYKCRATGDAFFAHLDPMDLKLAGEPRKLPFETLFGGVDVAIGPDRTLFRANKVVGEAIVTSLLWADHDGTLGEPADVGMSDVPHDHQVPANAHLAIDNEHHFHVPLVTSSGERSALIDYLPGDQLFVSAVEGRHSDNVALGPFPSMGATTGALRAGFGDGVVDGSGMIATMNAGGKLSVSNSQSGGYSYADSVLLNQDMQRAYKFRSTECYSRGANPNVVSMDYAFVEANDEHAPVSGELWLETWDMPLPEPVVDHAWDGDTLKITIVKSAWFFPGQTAFEISPALTEITEARQTGWREMVLTFADPSKVRGATVSFTTKNVFYNYHAAFVA